MNKISLRKIKKNDQSGAVAMLSVTIFAIIMTVVATSYIKSVISQQRTALSYDQGTRAYFAAESGVQDGVRAVQNDPAIRNSGKQDCKPINSDPNGELPLKDSEYGLSYTCQLIDVKSNEIKGRLVPGQNNAIIKIEPADTSFNGNFYIRFMWSLRNGVEDNTDDGTSGFYPRSTQNKTFPAVTKWNALNSTTEPIHAMLRVNTLTHKKSNFKPVDIKQNVFFLNPTAAIESGPTLTFDKNDSANSQQNTLIINSRCRRPGQFPEEDYACRRSPLFENYNLAENAFYVQLGSVYRATDFFIQVLEYLPNGQPSPPLPLANTQAIIDVTGKSGDSTYRRVKQTLPLDGYAEQSGPNASLVVGEGICKHLALGLTAAQYQSECNPMAP